MTTNDIWIVIVLGLVGYWGTAAVIQHFSKPKLNPEDKSQENFYHPQESQSQKETQKAEESDFRPAWSKILGVPESASLEEIKSAYKKLISMYHPDKVSGLGPEFNEIAQTRSKAINKAYEEAVKRFS